MVQFGPVKNLPRQMLLCTPTEFQQWVFRKETHICSLFPEDLCFTVTPSSSPMYPSFSLMPYDEASLSQQWAMDDETGMIVNVGSKLCLTGQYRENSWPSVGVANCNKEDEGQEWAFEPILFDGASKKCAPKLSKLKNNNIYGAFGYAKQFPYMSNFPMLTLPPYALPNEEMGAFKLN